jgi:hypothetical protein
MSAKYKLYQPKIEQLYLYQDKQDFTYAFGHMASIEYFDGRFHAVWNNHHGGHAVRYYKEKNEEMPFQRLLWQTSVDGKNWSYPIRITEEYTTVPLDKWSEPYTHWQPNLINYKDKELWCIWSLGKGTYFNKEKNYDGNKTADISGTYLSILRKGQDSKWVHRRIYQKVELHEESSGEKTVSGYLFPSQNPVIIKSGRLIQPVTVVAGTENNLGTLYSTAYYSAVIYTDDDGGSWNTSNLVSNVDNSMGQWEPHVMEQDDGILRMFIRDLAVSKGVHDTADIKYRTTLFNPHFLTTTGTGTKKGEPIRFNPDPQKVWVETDDSRMHRLKLPCGRYCMFYHDVWNACNKGARSNLAMFFSRSGRNDFVAGPGIAGRSHPAHYPQGIVNNGKLYVAYTRWDTSIRVGGSTNNYEERGIALSIISPLPSPDYYYIWPRDKDFFSSANSQWKVESTNTKYIRPYSTTQDGRESMIIQDCGTAGIEIDPVDFTKNERLNFAFHFKIKKAQHLGNLILCSFGSQIPIRIGLPGNRPGMLYAYGRYQWEKIGAYNSDNWNTLKLNFGADDFTVILNSMRAVSCINPIRFPEPRLYFGEGYETDQLESNRGSEFYIDIDSITTSVNKRGNKNG